MIDNQILQLTQKKMSSSIRGQDFLPLFNNSKYKVSDPCTLVEKVLISKLKTGDYPAFSNIFLAYYKDLVIFASRFTHNPDDAEEIVQDTFVRLWEEHESVKVNISLKSYLLKMVQNKCIDWYRHKKIRHTYSISVMENSPQFEYNTDNYILHSELLEKLEIALGMLPADISEAYRMNRDKGLKYHEIADILDVSVRTVEVRIGKALHLLRAHMKEYFTVITATILLLLQG